MPVAIATLGSEYVNYLTFPSTTTLKALLTHALYLSFWSFVLAFVHGLPGIHS